MSMILQLEWIWRSKTLQNVYRHYFNDNTKRMRVTCDTNNSGVNQRTSLLFPLPIDTEERHPVAKWRYLQWLSHL